MKRPERMITVEESITLVDRIAQQMRVDIDQDNTIMPELRDAIHKVIDEHILLSKEEILRRVEQRRGDKHE